MKFSTFALLCLTTVISTLVALPTGEQATTPAPEKIDPDSCSLKASPAYAKTKEAFAAFKAAQLYMMGAVINEKETHDELQEASKYQLTKVTKLIDEASTANGQDKRWLRKEFFVGQLKFLRLEVRVANKLLSKGLPSYPWLGKAVNWAKSKWQKLKDMWNQFWSDEEAPKHDVPKDPQVVDKGVEMAETFDNKLEEVDARMEQIEGELDRCEL